MIPIIVTICVLMFLNIPVGIVFRKAGFKFLDAFIPFKNIVVYSKIVNYKHKFFVILTVISLFLTLIGLMFFKGVIFGLIGLLSTFTRISLLCSAFASIMYMLEGIISYLGEGGLLFAIVSGFALCVFSICLFIFYCKLHYKFALNFGLDRRIALLYVFFQPIVIWFLAFGKWKFQEIDVKDNHNKGFGGSVMGNSDDVNVVSDFDNNQGQKMLSNVSVNQKGLVIQEKKNNKFFIIAMVIIIVLYYLISFIKFQKSGEEAVRIRLQGYEESKKVVEIFNSGALECSNYNSNHTKLSSERSDYYYKDSFVITGTLIKRETDGTCIEAYNYKYLDKINGKKTYVSVYSIFDYGGNVESLFRCAEHNGEVILLESELNKLNSKDGCDKLFEGAVETLKETFD